MTYSSQIEQKIIQYLQQNKNYWFYVEQINRNLQLNMDIPQLVPILTKLYHQGDLQYKTAGKINIDEIFPDKTVKEKGIHPNTIMFKFSS